MRQNKPLLLSIISDGGFFLTVYVDVLFVLNFFITYLLLMLTKALTKSTALQWRMLLGAMLGGIYSLVIFLPNLNGALNVTGKILASFLIVLAVFGFKRLIPYIKAVVCFYFSNLIFLGVILAVWLTVKPKGIVINNDTVYFDIPATVLLVLALIAYIISILIIKLYNYTISKKEIYSLTVIKDNREYRLYAFLDSGNRLCEPFSGYPVIIVDESKIKINPERVIPFNTVGGEGLLRAFKPDKIIISNGKNTFESDRVYVALSNVESKDFSAILNPILLNL